MSGVIGIDYDVTRVTMAAKMEPTGWWSCHHCPTKSWEEIVGLIQLLKDTSLATHVALEEPWLKRWKDKVTGKEKVATQAHAQLWRVYGRVQVLCEQVGLVVVPAAPTTWQADMLTPQHGKLGNRDDRKALSVLVARELGADIDTDHEADAVCMAEWLGKRLRLEEREVK